VPHKTTFDVLTVWAFTGIANIIGAMSEVLEYLPLIQHILAIVSILIAIAYTLYRFRKDWNGFNPKKKK